MALHKTNFRVAFSLFQNEFDFQDNKPARKSRIHKTGWDSFWNRGKSNPDMAYWALVLSWIPGIAGGQRIRVKRLHDKFTPPETFFYISLPGTISPSKVTAAGKPLPQKFGDTDEQAAKALTEHKDKPGAFYYNNYLKTTYIKIFDASSDLTVEAVFWINNARK